MTSNGLEPAVQTAASRTTRVGANCSHLLAGHDGCRVAHRAIESAVGLTTWTDDSTDDSN